jgi:hypothetical protein
MADIEYLLFKYLGFVTQLTAEGCIDPGVECTLPHHSINHNVTILWSVTIFGVWIGNWIY